MSFAKFSGERTRQNSVVLDPVFLTEYMPYANDNAVKVYLYGLNLCFNPDSSDSIEKMSSVLGLESEEIKTAISYWENAGLVRIDKNDGSLEYLPVRPKSELIRKFSKDKYKSFNEQLHKLIPSREIKMNEYHDYYNLMEIYGMEREAMLAVISYCLRKKGQDVHYHYMLKVARNLAEESNTSYDKVQKKLEELESYTDEISEILKALKLKRAVEMEDRHMYTTWTTIYGFKFDSILFSCKKVKKGGMEKLNRLITEFYENKIFTPSEINLYLSNKDKLYELAYSVNRTLGIKYDFVENEISTYISKWLNYGFNSEAILRIAHICFIQNIKTLDTMDTLVRTFYKEGRLTVESINHHISQLVSVDDKIREILAYAGENKTITAWDRDAYNTWTYAWKMPMEIINYTASLAKGKDHPIAYMNSILATFNEQNVRSLDDAKKSSPKGSSTQSSSVSQKKPEEIIKKTDYTQDELNALFSSLDTAMKKYE